MSLNKDELKEEIHKLKKDGKIILVEGKKDKIALNKVGVTNTHVLNKPLFEEVEAISKKHKEVIILTDLDKEGKKIYSKLNSKLGDFEVKIDNSFREFLFKNTKLRQIEGIYSYLEKLN
ncbi:toprim domain-containing protein [Candidatus Woesearchaeota archaeon]|nr:toprim domain-containing protein [Candidatus Woesearchaeota archaeon]